MYHYVWNIHTLISLSQPRPVSSVKASVVLSVRSQVDMAEQARREAQEAARFQEEQAMGPAPCEANGGDGFWGSKRERERPRGLLRQAHLSSQACR